MTGTPRQHGPNSNHDLERRTQEHYEWLAAEAALGAMMAHPFGREAAIIGDIVKKPEGIALVETAYGSRRGLEMPIEEQLARIC